MQHVLMAAWHPLLVRPKNPILGAVCNRDGLSAENSLLLMTWALLAAWHAFLHAPHLPHSTSVDCICYHSGSSLLHNQTAQVLPCMRLASDRACLESSFVVPASALPTELGCVVRGAQLTGSSQVQHRCSAERCSSIRCMFYAVQPRPLITLLMAMVAPPCPVSRLDPWRRHSLMGLSLQRITCGQLVTFNVISTTIACPVAAGCHTCNTCGSAVMASFACCE